MVRRKERISFLFLTNERIGNMNIVLIEATPARIIPFQKLFLETITKVTKSVKRIEGCPIPRENLGRKDEKKRIERIRNVVSKYSLLNFLASKKHRKNPAVILMVVARILAIDSSKKENGKK